MPEIVSAEREKHFAHIVQAQIDMAKETENMRLDEEKVKLGVDEVFNHPEKGAYYVAHENGAFAGCLLTTYEWSDWRNATCLWIQSVFIPKEFRRQGVFKKLYRFLQEKVKADPRLCGLRLYVDKTNLPAQKVYKSLQMDNQHYDLFEWMESE